MELVLLNLVQWPAMVLTLVASWWVASSLAHKRTVGFWLFIASNVLWAVWGIYAQAYALVVLQVGLFAMNLRGTQKTDAPEGK